MGSARPDHTQCASRFERTCRGRAQVRLNGAAILGKSSVARTLRIESARNDARRTSASCDIRQQLDRIGFGCWTVRSAARCRAAARASGRHAEALAGCASHRCLRSRRSVDGDAHGGGARRFRPCHCEGRQVSHAAECVDSGACRRCSTARESAAAAPLGFLSQGARPTVQAQSGALTASYRARRVDCRGHASRRCDLDHEFLTVPFGFTPPLPLSVQPSRPTGSSRICLLA
jgi:hypothetical protein